MINKILFITLSNIGDVILTLPSLDTLRHNFPQAKITCLTGPRPKEIFVNNPFIQRVIVFDKHVGLKYKLKLLRELKKERFDMVVDLRNSIFGVLLPAKYKISPCLRIPKQLKHMQDRHLYKIKTLISKIKTKEHPSAKETTLFISPSDKSYIKNILRVNRVQEKIVVVSLGARSQIKRWSKEKFAELILSLIKELGVKVILVGDKADQQLAEYIVQKSPYALIDLSGITSVSQLAYLLQNAQLLITNDSATLHLASYLNLPVLAIFGPTDEEKYGPWSDNIEVAKKNIFCRPCERAQCRFKTLHCTAMVKVEEVLKFAKEMLQAAKPLKSEQKSFKRILIVRTDRIGDVLLSTPVIKALRDTYPHAYLAMIVSPSAKEIVEGNPYLDGVIIYDKDGKHKSWMHSMKFARNLKKKKFDLAVILHPTNRLHLITFFAGIKKRVGYDRKLGFLLTDRIKHTKQLGEKHESEYNLDLVRVLGIEPKENNLYIPIKKESENWVEEFFRHEGIKESDKLLAIHPGASCPSKVWPNTRFGQVADRLVQRYGFKVLLVSGPKDIALAKSVIQGMKEQAINLAGMTSVSQLASVLKRCQLFISNDSGPVHIASALGMPVISIFGRSQKGLSPLRWGPLGKNSRVAHKTVGCVECLAHHCLRDFACLKAVTTDYVLNLADSILKDV